MDKADFEVGSLTTTTSATPVGGNVHVQTCGHHLHLRCWSSYLASLRGAQRFNADRYVLAVKIIMAFIVCLLSITKTIYYCYTFAVVNIVVHFVDN